MIQKFQHFGFLVGIILFFSTCKSVAVLPTKRPIKNVDITALVSKIKSNYPRVKRLSSRIRATYDDGKRTQQIIAQLRMDFKKKNMDKREYDRSYCKTYDYSGGSFIL